MKKIVVLISFMAFAFSTFAGEDITYFRKAFVKIKDYKTAKSFLATEIEVDNKRDITAIYGYKAVCTMMVAQYVFNPVTKYSYFNKGKEMLAQSIKAEKNVENIYLRLIVQLNAPGFLGYNKEIAEDTEYIKEHIDSEDISIETKVFILKNLLETGKVDSLKEVAKKYKLA